MYIYTINAKADFDGVEYGLPIRLIGNNKQLSSYPFSNIIDYTEGSTIAGVPTSKVMSDINQFLGFSVTNFPFYITNDGSIRLDGVDDKGKRILTETGVNLIELYTDTPIKKFENPRFNNGYPIHSYGLGPLSISSSGASIDFNVPSQITGSVYASASSNYVDLQFRVMTIPYRSISSVGIDKSIIPNNMLYYIFSAHGFLQPDYNRLIWSELRISVSKSSDYYTNALDGLIDDINSQWDDLISDGDITQINTSNPYEVDTPSNIGGGDGSFEDPDKSVKVDFPDLPSLSAVSTGLLTIFNPTLTQINLLGDYLWSNAFDLDSLKKLFGDPMEAIIGLSIVPVRPILAGSKNVKVGNVDTGISMPYCASQFVEKNIGSINIKKYIGSFMDYSPYTKIQIYLPYIGIRDLSPDDVMNESITVKYHIDILTGGCAAMISVGQKGVLYQFNGSCIANVPMTAINYSGAIQNAVSAIGSGVTTLAGIATGTAPITGVGLAGLATSAANTAVNSKPSIQRSGSMGGSSGLMSVQQCYLIITRPRMSVPNNLNEFSGYPSNINVNLGSISGYTVIDAIRLDNIPCTDSERDELMNILKGGIRL